MRRILTVHPQWLLVPVIALLLGTLTIAEIVLNPDGTLDAKATFDEELYKNYLTSGIYTDAELVDRFDELQAQWLPLVPPHLECLRQHAGITYFEPTGFPKRFLNGLRGITIAGGAVVYPVLIREDIRTRNRIFRNIDGKEIGRADPPEDYDPHWYLLEIHPDIYQRSRSMEEITTLEAMHDPSRLELRYDLILEEDLITYIIHQSVQPPPIIMMKASYEGGSVTNIILVDLDRESDGRVSIAIAYPDDFTNNLDIFSIDSGSGMLDFWWDLRITTNINTATNWIEWTDTDATNATGRARFYVIGNADINIDTDPDGDGLTWAREKYLYHTSPTNSDTDTDGYDDYEEVITYRTDPNNDDTTIPTTTISTPEDGWQKVVVP